MIGSVKKYGTIANKPTIGVLTHFAYDAKLKDYLPTWDRFPLCLPIHPYKDGFLGLNLHYVTQRTRKVILDQLMKHMDYYDKDPRARIMADYAFLKAASNFDDIKPCIKRYLRDHVESQFLNINPIHFDKIIKLPTARWMGPRPY